MVRKIYYNEGYLKTATFETNIIRWVLLYKIIENIAFFFELTKQLTMC